MCQHLLLQKVKERKLFNFFLCVVLGLAGCHPNEVQRIKGEKFDMVGVFVKDKVPDGLIKYFKPNSDTLVSTSKYINGILNGNTVNYYRNKVVQVQLYMNGVKDGYTYIYDTTKNFLCEKDFYFKGRRIGPSYTLNEMGEVLSFDFTDFENKIVYKVSQDSTGNYHAYKIEDLVTLNASEELDAPNDKIRVFFYLIYPPKATTTYKIAYFNKSDSIVKSINVSNRPIDLYFDELVDSPSQDQKLALVVSRYDSILQKQQSVVTYMVNRDVLK
jgi:hypothetical protein